MEWAYVQNNWRNGGTIKKEALERLQISNLVLNPKFNSYTAKTHISNTTALEKVVFGMYEVIFGVSAKVDILFYSNFNKEQNPHIIKEIFYIQILNFGIYCHYLPLVFGILVIGLYKLVFGVRSKLDILFHSNFNKEQNCHSLTYISFMKMMFSDIV